MHYTITLKEIDVWATSAGPADDETPDQYEKRLEEARGKVRIDATMRDWESNMNFRVCGPIGATTDYELHLELVMTMVRSAIDYREAGKRGDKRPVYETIGEKATLKLDEDGHPLMKVPLPPLVYEP